MPVERAQVHQHRAARVGHVGRVHAAARARRSGSTAATCPSSRRPARRSRPARARPGRCRGSTRSSAPRSTSTAAARRARAGGRGPARRRARARARPCACPARRSRCGRARRLARSQTTVVSRWLVMPDRGDLLRGDPPAASACVDHLARAPPDLDGVVLHPAGAAGGSARARAGPSAATAPSASKRISRRAGRPLVDGRHVTHGAHFRRQAMAQACARSVWWPRCLRTSACAAPRAPRRACARRSLPRELRRCRCSPRCSRSPRRCPLPAAARAIGAGRHHAGRADPAGRRAARAIRAGMRATASWAAAAAAAAPTRSGPRRREVAIGFDDGPAADTARVRVDARA